jgi:hypothetical protein
MKIGKGCGRPDMFELAFRLLYDCNVAKRSVIVVLNASSLKPVRFLFRLAVGTVSIPVPSHRRSLDVLLLQASILALLLVWSGWLYSIGDYVTLIAICTSMDVVILYWAAVRFGIFDARFLFLAVSSLYPLVPVVDIFITGYELYDIQYASLTLLFTMLSFSGFFAVSSLDFSISRKMPISDVLIDRISSAALVGLLLVAFVGYLLFFYRDVGFAMGSLTRAEITSAISAPFAALRLSFIVGLLLLVAKFRSTHLEGGRQVFSNAATGREAMRVSLYVLVGLVAVFGFMEVILLGERRLFLTFALASLCIAAPRRIPLPVVIATPLLLIAFLIQVLIRDAPVEDWASRLNEKNIRVVLNPVNTDFGAFGRIAEDILSGGPTGHFPSYSDAVLTLVPRVLYPDRPEPIGVWFVRRYHPKDWVIGGGLAFNLVVEAVLNLGWLGPVILGMLLGLLFSVFIHSSVRNRLNQGLLVFALVFAMRFDMATLLKTVFIVASAAAAWVLILIRLRGSRSQAQSQPT